MMALATEALLTPDYETSSAERCCRDPSAQMVKAPAALLDTIFVSVEKHALFERRH